MSISVGLPSIIPVSPYHAQVLATLHQACFSPGWTVHNILGFLNAPGTAALAELARAEASYEPEPNNVLTGFIMYRCVADECEIITLCVRPKNRRQGTAQRLLSALEDVLAGGSVINIFLEVEVDNSSALKLYEKAGYVHTGRRKNYYKNEDGRQDALLYRRALLVKS